MKIRNILYALCVATSFNLSSNYENTIKLDQLNNNDNKNTQSYIIESGNYENNSVLFQSQPTNKQKSSSIQENIQFKTILIKELVYKQINIKSLDLNFNIISEVITIGINRQNYPIDNDIEKIFSDYENQYKLIINTFKDHDLKEYTKKYKDMNNLKDVYLDEQNLYKSIKEIKNIKEIKEILNNNTNKNKTLQDQLFRYISTNNIAYSELCKRLSKDTAPALEKKQQIIITLINKSNKNLQEQQNQIKECLEEANKLQRNEEDIRKQINENLEKVNKLQRNEEDIRKQINNDLEEEENKLKMNRKDIDETLKINENLEKQKNELQSNIKNIHETLEANNMKLKNAIIDSSILNIDLIMNYKHLQIKEHHEETQGDIQSFLNNYHNKKEQ